MKTLQEVIEMAKQVAKRYRELTGKPLGITGEIGEVITAELLGLKLSNARQPGYDAIAPDGRKIQIKSRCVLPDSSPGQKVGKIKFDTEWDALVLILMNEDFDPLEIYEAKRNVIERALILPGFKAKNERGALSVSKFKSISSLMWNASDKSD